MSQSIEEIVTGEEFVALRHELRLDRREAYLECANCDKYSFGDDIRGASEFWSKRISGGEITDPEELEYLSKIADLGEPAI